MEIIIGATLFLGLLAWNIYLSLKSKTKTELSYQNVIELPSMRCGDILRWENGKYISSQLTQEEIDKQFQETFIKYDQSDKSFFTRDED